MNNLNQIVRESNNRSEILTLGEYLFCDAYVNENTSLMNDLLKHNIKCNDDVYDIFTEIIKEGEFALLKEILDGAYTYDNYNYRGEHLLNIILNQIPLYHRELRNTDNAFVHEILSNTFHNIKLSDIEDYNLIHILSNKLFHPYIPILIDRGFDSKNSCILQLSSRDGDDCFISEATRNLDSLYKRMITYEVFDRYDCEGLFNTFIKFPEVAMDIATLYPEQFLYCENEFDNTDSVGFTREEVKKLKSMGLNIFAFRDVDDCFKDVFTIYRG